MRYLFNNAWSFNQPLNNWNVSKVEDMNSMFNGASSRDAENKRKRADLVREEQSKGREGGAVATTQRRTKTGPGGAADAIKEAERRRPREAAGQPAARALSVDGRPHGQGLVVATEEGWHGRGVDPARRRPATASGRGGADRRRRRRAAAAVLDFVIFESKYPC